MFNIITSTFCYPGGAFFYYMNFFAQYIAMTNWFSGSVKKNRARTQSRQEKKLFEENKLAMSKLVHLDLKQNDRYLLFSERLKFSTVFPVSLTCAFYHFFCTSYRI
jgi:hypothetical protein